MIIYYFFKKRSLDCLFRYVERIYIDFLNFCLIVVILGINLFLRGINVNLFNMFD